MQGGNLVKSKQDTTNVVTHSPSGEGGGLRAAAAPSPAVAKPSEPPMSIDREDSSGRDVRVCTYIYIYRTNGGEVLRH